MVGDYEGVIKDVTDQQKLAEQLPQTFDIVYSRFRSSLLLGYTYVQMGKKELGLDILNQIDTTTTFFEDYWRTKVEYYGYLALSYYESGKKETGIEYFNNIDQLIKSLYKNDRAKITNTSDIHNWPVSWGILAQACKANYLVEKNDLSLIHI